MHSPCFVFFDYFIKSWVLLLPQVDNLAGLGILVRCLVSLKGPLLGLRQFLAIESLLKMAKNTFYLIFKALFILEICSFLL